MNKTLLRQLSLIALVLLMAVLVFNIVAPFLAPLALGMIFSVVLQPLYIRVRRMLHGRETLASLVTVLLCALAVLIPMIYFGFQLLQEGQGIYISVSQGGTQPLQQQFLDHVGPIVHRFAPLAFNSFEHFVQNLGGYAQGALTWLFQHVGVAFSGVSSFLLQLFIFLITLYYLLRDGKNLRQAVAANSPLSDKDNEIVFTELERSVNSVVKGKLLIAVIQGVFSGIGLMIFGVPNPLFWGLVAAFASLIPPLGTANVLIPAILYLLFTGSPGGALGLTIWAALAGVIDNIVGPKLMTAGTQFHPLLMLVSVLGGLAFFGPVGIFLGPIAVSFFVTLLSLYRHLE